MSFKHSNLQTKFNINNMCIDTDTRYRDNDNNFKNDYITNTCRTPDTFSLKVLCHISHNKKSVQLFMFTFDFKHCQSSTRGRPGSLTDCRIEEPFVGPNNKTPINSTLPSKCFLCFTVSAIFSKISFVFSV
jgi:hypothetical protein